MDAECTFEEACYRETQKVSKTILQSLKEITDKWPLENKLSKEISEKLLSISQRSSKLLSISQRTAKSNDLVFILLGLPDTIDSFLLEILS